ncbi:MAG TPA: pentapeptide repeat-containing protein [Pyrinomonadaceae bacterium]|jgi:uncharacterized protein YjbI with pentapeptide repeats
MAELISFLTSEALKPLLKELLRIRRRRREELDAIADTFGDPIDLAKFYIEPRCQHQNPADFDEGEPISIVRSQIFSTINDFFNREFSASGGGKNTMFVLSDAGMGKTSLLVMIKLSHITEFWPQHYSCKLFKLDGDTLQKISEVPNKGRTILLLDSLDEDPLSWEDTERRILNILEATANFRRVIITCRTQYFPKTAADPFNRPGRVELGGYVCPMLFLSYFDERQVDQYLSKRFPSRFIRRLRKQPSQLHKRAKELLSKVQSLQFRPLLLAHIEDLLASRETNWDDYGVYQALVEAWLLREERKLRAQGHQASKEHLIKACTDVALFMQTTRQRVITRDELENLIQSSPTVSYLKQLNFGGRALLNRNSNGDYRFSHYSIQEFLLAYHILNNQTPASLFEFAVTDQMLRFILGRLDQYQKMPRSVVTKTLHVFNEYGICVSCGMSTGYASYTNQSICKVTQKDIASFIFSGLKFDELNLSSINLSGHIFSFCSFIRAALSNTDLSNCDLSNANFGGANLANTDLQGALLDGASFEGAIWDGMQSDVLMSTSPKS